ncbi:RNA-directed DNA polymerase, eukaryota, reverse transcriptase zinc-binding domain protein [Tanacetum coccineum]
MLHIEFEVNEKKDDESKKDSGDCSQRNLEEEENLGTKEKCSNKYSIDDAAESVCSGHFKKSEGPRTGGSILNLMDELVKVGQTMGYNMEGCLAQKAKNDWVKELCIRNKVNFLTLQETKMEDVELFNVKMCWGNFAFDYVHSASVGNSGGILCVWDPSSFNKMNAMVSDYFVMIRGVWLKNGEVVIMGDFNEVRKKTERFGLMFNVQGANLFNMFIANAGLDEVPLAISLDRYLSDHRPILMRKVHFDYGLIPFRFFHYWFEMDDFDKLVEDSWKETPMVESNAITNLMMKLKHLKVKIREWNKDKKKNASNRKVRIKEELAELENLQSLETAQKDKVKWAIEGDENSKFYHGILNKKMNQLNIRGILIDGIWTDDPRLVKHEFLQHFKKRFDKPVEQRFHLDMNFPRTLSSDQQADLEIEVSREEIKRAVWDCRTDKSPSPDGFTFGFYRRYWKIVKKEVVDAVTYFFTHGFLPKGSNSSFIALIPKIPDANMVKDFRPISLIGSLYKIIAKILANRLVVVLGDIVNEVQSAFVTDRQILDGPFILNELFQWCKVKKKQTLIFKVDFEKAYDSVRWDFLDDVLRKFGFGKKWCNWIQSCLRSSRGSIIINGSHMEEFQFYKGLKQGDPLSPFLFLLVMESLHISFQRVVEAGMFKGVTLSSSLQISHMFYADDAVFVGQWNDVNIDTIIHVLFLEFRCVLKRLESIRGRFFNGHDINSKKTSWVKWKNVLASKEKGGIGVLIIKAIHEDDGKVGKKTKSVFPSIWIDIVHEMKSLKNQDIDILKCMKFKIGNGEHTAFWDDVWRGDIAFKNLYPRLYALESCKNIVVACKLAHPCLDHSFRRAPRSGVEQEQFIALINQVQSVSLVPCGDIRVWSLEGSGEFSIASVRKLIDDKILPEVSSKTRWVKAIPSKVNVHAWKVRLDYLPMRFNISRRGMVINSISCPICDNGVELTSHLLFSYQIVKDIVRWWDISFRELSSYEEWVVWLSNLRLSTLVWLLEEIHVTWAHLKKKQTRLQLYIQVEKDNCLQTVETASKLPATPSGFQRDGVRLISGL